MCALTELLHHLRQKPGEPLPAALAGELQRALDAWSNGACIQAALQSGSRKRRDSALARAGELLRPESGSWCRAGAVLEAITRLERRAPMVARTSEEKAVLAALEAGAVPRSQQQLFRILDQHSSGGNVGDDERS